MQTYVLSRTGPRTQPVTPCADAAIMARPSWPTLPEQRTDAATACAERRSTGRPGRDAGSTPDREDGTGPRLARGGEVRSSAARTVLIVDDVAETRELLRWQLSAEPGLEVVGEATNGEEGVQQALRLRPDVLVLDLYMPTQGGFTTLPLLRRELPDTRIVVVTSFDSPDARETSLDLGATSYAVKGIGRAEFLRLVRQAALLE